MVVEDGGSPHEYRFSTRIGRAVVCVLGSFSSARVLRRRHVSMEDVLRCQTAAEVRYIPEEENIPSQGR